jgi:hypothetical protein
MIAACTSGILRIAAPFGGLKRCVRTGRNRVKFNRLHWLLRMPSCVLPVLHVLEIE